MLSLGGATVTTVTTTFNSNEKKSDKRIEAEQRIQACGQTTIHLGGVTDEEMDKYADSVEAAKDRRLNVHPFAIYADS